MFRPNNIQSTLNRSIDESKTSKHYLDIYDNSSINFVDRLIIVNPYGWMFWNIDGAVYIFDSILSKCDGTPAYQVPPAINNTFTLRCLNFSYIDFMNYYMKMPHRKENFEPLKNFTIIDCLELLSGKYLKIETNGRNNQTKKVYFDPQKLYADITLQYSSGEAADIEEIVLGE